LHYYLLADILKEIGHGLSEHGSLDETHLHALQDGAAALTSSLKSSLSSGSKKK
jgi:hypothetical protein